MAVNNIMAWLLVIELTFLALAAVNSYPAFENNEYKHKIRDKGRSIRGFKNMDLSTARGFGKRSDGRRFDVNLLPSDLLVENSEDKEFNQNVPMDVETVLKNKYLARSLLEKFDVNRDGFISVNEFLLQQNDGESL